MGRREQIQVTSPMLAAVLTAAPATGFSAVAYFFGREIQHACAVPVGMIVNAWPGSPAESWVSREALVAEPDLRLFAERFDRTVRTYPEQQAQHAEAVHAFERQRAETEPYTVDAADVIVVGAGASGIPAAIGAAREGVRVLLVEEDQQPGGACVDHL